MVMLIQPKEGICVQVAGEYNRGSYPFVMQIGGHGGRGASSLNSNTTIGLESIIRGG